MWALFFNLIVAFFFKTYKLLKGKKETGYTMCRAVECTPLEKILQCPICCYLTWNRRLKLFAQDRKEAINLV